MKQLILLICLLAAPQRALAQTADTPTSPTLRLLTATLRHSPTAERDFWNRLEGTGAPLIEPIPGDSTQQLVTFVWQGDESTDAVAVITPLSLIDFRLGEMRRVQGTHVWYQSISMRNDAVLLYRFGPNDTMVPFDQEPNLPQRMAAWRVDPLNRRHFGYSDGSRASLLVLGPPETEQRPTVGHGEVHADTIWRSSTDTGQTVWTYTSPTRADDTGEATLLVLLDGDSYIDPMDVVSVLDRMTETVLSQPVVAVLLPADPARRAETYNCNPAWSAFLAEDLMTWIQRRFRISPDSRDRIVGGYSLGGLAAACAAVAYPTVFGNVLAQSGSFYRSSDSQPEGLARRLASIDRLPIRWSLQIGLLETAPIPSRDPSMLTASRHLRDVLLAKGYAVTYHEFFGGHELPAWAALLPDALAQLLSR
jgi:enterochelin esterase family protein